MKKVGIAIDARKKEIFERHLARSGYEFVVLPGLTTATLTLTVETENVGALGIVVKAANDEAAKSKFRPLPQ
jgi:hypothetical protein